MGPGMPESWLNDEIINGYIELIKDRHRKNPATKEKLVFFNTYAYPKLVQLSKEGKIHQFDRILKRKKLGNLSQYDRLFFPVNIERHHWLLLVVNISTCKYKDYKTGKLTTSSRFEFYDSIKGESEASRDILLQPVKEYLQYR